MIDQAHDNSSQPRFDAGTQQVASVYAKALLGATEKAGNTAAVVDELDALVESLQAQPRFEEVLGSQLLGDDEKQAIIDRVYGPRFSPMLVDFLRVLSAHGRLTLLRPIHAEIRRQLDELRGIIPVQVTTAAPLDAAAADKLRQSLRAIVRGEPRLETSVDPQLIGGAVLRVGDTVYDGSVARQLEQLRSQIIHRSVHEIQSRRDRFRHSGGN
jgi:F-type H+-transporting ATPase subunit delta